MIRRPRRSTLFPATPLFRSGLGPITGLVAGVGIGVVVGLVRAAGYRSQPLVGTLLTTLGVLVASNGPIDRKSTPSELQSRQYLVCRLLLEKKGRPEARRGAC